MERAGLCDDERGGKPPRTIPPEEQESRDRERLAPLSPACGRQRYDAAVRAPVRVVLVVLGLAVVVYGVASLTGGWLGTPPWWLVLTTAVAGVVALGVGISRAMGDGGDDISRLNRSGNPPETFG